MRVGISYAGGSVELEIDQDRLVGSWLAPNFGGKDSSLRDRVRAALENPRDYPPLRSAVVPGDRVAVAFAAGITGVAEILAAVAEVLSGVGIRAEDLTVLWPGPDAPAPEGLPGGFRLTIHDPADRSALAYLASTATGRRVYLNRLLTDADFVLPIGRFGYDPALGFAGPWSVIFPGLSDEETRRDLASSASLARPDPEHPRAALAESTEVSWLLGSQFQVGVHVGRDGTGAVEAGQEAAVRREGSRRVAADWTVQTPDTAQLVIAGVGLPGEATDWRGLAAGMAAAARLVQPGGKIVMLSQARGAPGPAVQHLSSLSEHDLGPSGLAECRTAPDYAIARQIAETLVRADVYLLSEIDPELVEDLGMVPLARVGEAARLAGTAASVFVLEAADSVWVRSPDED